MMVEDKRARAYLGVMSEMESERSTFTADWDEIVDLMRPNQLRVGEQRSSSRGRTDRIYDGSPVIANQKFASGLNGLMTSNVQPWFILKANGIKNPTRNSKIWLEVVTQLILEEYADSDSTFYGSMSEGYEDIGSFGTTVVYQRLNRKTRNAQFSTIPLRDCYMRENSDNKIDTLYRRINWSGRQIEQEYGKFLPKKLMEAIAGPGGQVARFNILHAVHPRTDRNTEKMNSANKPFASMHICENTGEIVKESGFDLFPYHVGRWKTIAGEVYARSPAMNALPDIRMVNELMRMVLKGVQKKVDPPIMVPDDGFLLPLRTGPGDLMFYESGSVDDVKVFDNKAQIAEAYQTLSDIRARIGLHFFNDLFSRERKRAEQTAFEISDERAEMANQLSPMTSKLQSEFFNNIIKNTFNILGRLGKLPPLPSELVGTKLEIEYVSPANKLQLNARARGMNSFVQAITPMASVAPDIVDRIDPDRFVDRMQQFYDVPEDVMRSDEEVEAIRESRKQQEQQQREVEIGAQVASTAKDASVATKNLGERF